jgi:hypothetical protein
MKLPPQPLKKLARWWRRGLSKWHQWRQRLAQVIDPSNELHAPIRLPKNALERLSPFYLLLNEQGVVQLCGASMRVIHPGELVGHLVEDLFDDLEAISSDSWFDIGPQHMEHRLTRLEAKCRPGLEFAGQLIPLFTSDPETRQDRARQRWILDLRPILENLDDLEQSGLSLQDLSLLDPMRVSMVTMLMNDSLRHELLSELRSTLN